MTADIPSHEDVKADLLQKIEAEDSGLDVSEELEAEHQAELAAGNITHLRSFLVGQEGEEAETVAAEQTALRAAVTEVAAEHEGVSETLIMMWINGEEIGDQMVGLHERGIRTFRDLRDDEDAVRTIQQIGVELGLDLGEEGVNGDYNEATEAAMRQLQAALVEAGYDLGEFGPNNDGIDGAIGQVSMNIMMNAARSTAPGPGVVDDAIAIAAGEERSVTRRTNEFNAIGVEGETSTPRTGEISAEHMDEYASVLARGMEGVQYDADAQTFTHTLTDETLPVADVISGNYEDVDRSAMQSSLAEFSTAQVSAFAEEQGVEVTNHEGSPHFEHEGRKMSVDDILSDQEPLAMFERWQSGEIEGVEAEVVDEDYEETEIPAAQLAPLKARVEGTAGVRAVNDDNTVVLFDGTELSLERIYSGLEGEINEQTELSVLDSRIHQEAESFARENNMAFVPAGTNTSIPMAHWTTLDGSEQIFTVEELTTGVINNEAPFNSPTNERADVLAGHFDRLQVGSD